MVYFHITDWKAHEFLIWFLCIALPTNSKEIRLQLPDKDVITNFLKEYVRPYVHKLENPNSPIYRALKDEDDVDIPDVIKKKVKDTESLLQDNYVPPEDDKLTLEGDDETTIIEFVPHINKRVKGHEKTNAFKEKIDKYKRLRNKIKKALKKEPVSNKTKTLVTKTLDEMIAQMIGHQCTWKKDTNFRGTMFKASRHDRTDVLGLSKVWKELWNKLKREFMRMEPTPDEKQEKFLNKFQNIMSGMANDFRTVLLKYNVVCGVMNEYQNEYNKDLKNIIRTKNKDPDSNLKQATEEGLQGHRYDEKLPCTNFKVCSRELTEYLNDFYKNLNDTAMSVVKNYAAMFLRDVSDDGYHEKERIVGLIDKTSKIAEGKVKTIFKKQLEKLKLDTDKNEYANVRIIGKFVEKTIARTKKQIHGLIVSTLSTVREKLVKTIQKDIDVNMDVDLGNLEREINSKMCPNFEFCNGRYFGARRGSYVGDRNNVYVKVQLDIDDSNTSPSSAKKVEEKDTVARNTSYKSFKVIFTKTPAYMNVTRTAPRFMFRIEPYVANNKINTVSKDLLNKDSNFSSEPKDKWTQFNNNLNEINDKTAPNVTKGGLQDKLHVVNSDKENKFNRNEGYNVRENEIIDNSSDMNDENGNYKDKDAINDYRRKIKEEMRQS